MTDQPAPTYEGRRLPHPDEAVFDQGFGFDLETLSRRRALRLVGGSLGAAVLAACGVGSSPTSGATGGSASASTATGSCAVIPQEAAGPFPADGSNGLDVLAESGVVRRDITTSFAGMTGTADGVPLEIELQLTDADGDCAAFAGAAVYVWHCDRNGFYSLYSPGATDENYLRGVQEADTDGVVRFTSIVPGCYPGRWPHVHFEVFPDLASASDVGTAIATSQLALTQESCEAVYVTAGYESSVQLLSQLSLEGDVLFRDDGGVRQLATMSGDPASGYTARLALTV